MTASSSLHRIAKRSHPLPLPSPSPPLPSPPLPCHYNFAGPTNITSEDHVCIQDTRIALLLLVHLLPRVTEVTAIVALQHQLLIPSIAWAMPILHTLKTGDLPDCSMSKEVCFYHCITSDSLVFSCQVMCLSVSRVSLSQAVCDQERMNSKAKCQKHNVLQLDLLLKSL